jgi:hypothetical protein
MDEWLLGRRNECKCTLDHIARSFGLDGKNGDGAEFAALYDQDEGAALNYLSNDLKMTAGVAAKLGLK